MKLIPNPAGGLDLELERDSGNEVLILTGKRSNSLAFYRELQPLIAEALHEMLMRR